MYLGPNFLAQPVAGHANGMGRDAQHPAHLPGVEVKLREGQQPLLGGADVGNLRSQLPEEARVHPLDAPPELVPIVIGQQARINQALPDGQQGAGFVGFHRRWGQLLQLSGNGVHQKV